jgi:hypothetical protein
MNQDAPNIFKKTIRFFDRFEDKVRAGLSRKPIVYSFIGGVAIVLFWRGVWMLADEIGLSSWSSITISVIIMLATGLFVSFFVGDRIVMSGLRHEKKAIEKAQADIAEEQSELSSVQSDIRKIEKSLEFLTESEKKRRG